ncbi:hypothetical protein [Pseudonocardia sp. NPDC049154]|uniref:ABC transporter ATP-binding protein C-terminal domain-containing protein n=1 Tax=Pseudonocardia sp. NPDC049154 TaxID=3155501 RepID=UPI0033F2440E
MWPLRTSSPLARMIATLGVLIIPQALVTLRYGVRPTPAHRDRPAAGGRAVGRAARRARRGPRRARDGPSSPGSSVGRRASSGSACCSWSTTCRRSWPPATGSPCSTSAHQIATGTPAEVAADPAVRRADLGVAPPTAHPRDRDPLSPHPRRAGPQCVEPGSDRWCARSRSVPRPSRVRRRGPPPTALPRAD